MKIMTKPSQSRAATADVPPTTSTMPLLMTQDDELMGDERFIRRVFVPNWLSRKRDRGQLIAQSRLTVQSSQHSGSRKPSLEIRLNVSTNLDPSSASSQEEGQVEAGLASQLRGELATEALSESYQMIDMVDNDDTRLNQGASGSRHYSSQYSEPEQMPQPEPQQQPAEDQMPHQQSSSDSCKFTFEKVFQRSFLGVNQSFLIAKKKLTREEIAIRIRSGSSGRSEWLNELQVYLIPNFRHANILDYLGFDQSQSLVRKKPSRLVHDELPSISDIRRRNFLLDSYEEQKAEEYKEKQMLSLDDGVRLRLQYWLLNRFDNCIVLRDYLRERVLNWAQMIHIARGIINGLHYLHENGEYQEIDKEQAVQEFIKSTNGALKRVAFVDRNSKIMMWPQHTCSIIHRNLNSMNIVLRGPDLTPCIWNFGHSKIHHPFQPTNHVNLIDQRLKEVFMSSPYSSPEVLQEKAYLTLTAMKSIDMYACGILFWELLSRCQLPKILEAFEQENQERQEPEPYHEPFEREFGPNPSTAMLTYAVCRLHARPKLKDSWLLGKKSYSFTQTIQDLWDQDFDARVHTLTVMDRLGRIDLSDDDTRHDFTPRNSKSFDAATQWPPKVESIQVPPFLDKCEPNIVFLD